MKKYLISTLTAAAAMAVPAFALDGDGKSASTAYTGEVGGADKVFSTSSTETVYVATDSAPLGGSTTNSYFNAGTYLSNIIIGAGGIVLTNGNSGDVTIFAGSISGTGNWTYDNTSHSTVVQQYTFTGSLAGYSGNIDFSLVQFQNTASSGTTNTSQFNFGTGGTAAADEKISGTGSIAINGNIGFNYSGYATYGDSAITVENTSITARALEFAGSVNYSVSSNLIGYNSSSTLTISTQGTTTVTGSISGFSSITVNSGSTLAVSGSVDISSPIANSGTVTINSSASFVLDNMGYTGDWSTGATYTLITGTGTVTGYDSLTIDNVSYTLTGGSIDSATFNYDNGTLTVTVTGTEGEQTGGLHGDGTIYNPYYTSGTTAVGFDMSNFTGAGTTVYLATDTHSFGNASESVYWNSGTAACDIVIGAAGIYLTNGAYRDVYSFTGAISGDGSWTVTGYTSGSTSGGGNVRQHYSFTGDLSAWNGDLTISTTNAEDYVVFGGTMTTDANGHVTAITGVTAVTNESISGNGAIAVDYGTVHYAYTGYASGGSVLTVTNKSIEAHTIEFGGTVNYDVSSNLKGWDGSGASDGDSSTNSTLTISTTGTVTVSGEVSGFDHIVVSSGSGLTVAAGATVTLKEGGDLTVNSGATLTLNTSIAASAGTVEFASGASLVLTDAFLASTINTLDTYDAVTIITASSITYNGSELSEENIDEFASIVSTSDNYLLDNWSYADGVLSASVTYLPEPSMFGVFFGLGAIGLVATRRRRRR